MAVSARVAASSKRIDAESQAKFSSIGTRADAETYASDVILKAKTARANRAIPPAPRASVQSG